MDIDRAPTMVCPVAAKATRQPHHPAIICDHCIVTYADLDERARSVCYALVEAGIGEADVLAVRAPASIEYVTLLVACLRLGVIIAPLSTRLPDHEVASRASGLRAKALLNADGLASLTSTADSASGGGEEWHLDRPATIIYTSGSGGFPRAVVHSVRNHVASAAGSASNIPIDASSRWLLSLPLYHVGGLAVCFRCLLTGAGVVISEGSDSDAIRRHGITHVSFVPTQLQRILDSENDNWAAGLRAVLLGGSLIPESLITRALDADVPIHTSYGLTEMASQVATTRPKADAEELLTAGYVLPEREVRIDAEGRIHVRGGTRCLGFLVDGSIEQPFDSDGWYATGDAGSFDQHGRLVVHGRIDEVFISGGENIHPSEIERALLRLPMIREAVVVPVSDVEFGHRPVAFVRTDGVLDEESTSHALAADLPRYMIPIRYLPLPPVKGLKPDRRALADTAERVLIGGT